MDNKESTAKSHYGIVNFERRQYPRYSIDLPMKYTRADASTGHIGRTGNISEGGLLVSLPEKVEVGERLEVQLFFASLSETMQSINLLAEVVWTDFEPGEMTTSHRSGLKFIDVDPADMTKLREFLKSLER